MIISKHRRAQEVAIRRMFLLAMSRVNLSIKLVEHILLVYSIAYSLNFIQLKALIDTNVFENCFINKFYALEQKFKLKLLNTSINLESFDNFEVKFKLINYYCLLFLSINDIYRYIRFYVISLFKWKIVIDLF